MSDLLYNKDLLRWAADAYAAGRLSEPHVSGDAHNAVCGDKVHFDLRLADGRIAEVAQEAKACILTQASASILGRRLNGARREDVVRLMETVAAMLESHGSEPLPPFSEFGIFAGTVAYPARYRCVFLPLEAVLAAFDASEAR